MKSKALIMLLVFALVWTITFLAITIDRAIDQSNKIYQITTKQPVVVDGVQYMCIRDYMQKGEE